MSNSARRLDRRSSHAHGKEPHAEGLAGRLNWLRAGVLGANDGIISTAGLVIGVAAASTSTSAIATAGVAGLVSGAVSMALGEYVSVSAQRDTEQSLIHKEKRELATHAEAEHRELVGLLRTRGMTEPTAQVAARELAEHDALGAHLEMELGIREEEVANPVVAAFSSALAFSIGAALPLLSILLTPTSVRIAVTFLAVLVGLAITGGISARLGGAPRRTAILRLVVGGAIAMAVTFGIGQLVGVAVG